VLQLPAEGGSNREVAATLDVGLSTVETPRANLMQKPNLHNTAEIGCSTPLASASSPDIRHHFVR
jgi:DNA-binding NarL/FixJ family response regulator